MKCIPSKTMNRIRKKYLNENWLQCIITDTKYLIYELYYALSASLNLRKFNMKSKEISVFFYVESFCLLIKLIS